MRILKFIDLGFEAGGAEKSVRLASEGLRDRGHEVTIVATDLLWTGQPRFADRTVPAISGGPAKRLLSHFWYRDGYREVRRILDEVRPDCVHFHTIGGFSPSLLAAARDYPGIVYLHGPEDWNIDLLRWRLPSATSPDGLSAVDRLRYLHLRFVQRPAYRRRLRRIGAAAPVSEFMAACVRRDLPGVPVQVINNVREEGFTPTEITDPDHAVYLGRLAAVKGVDVLIAAFRKVAASNPRARLTVVGEGPDRERLTGLAADLVAAGRVVFTGWQGREDLVEHVRAAGVVVIPSLWPEAFGRVVLDAYSSGRPVVASRIGGLPELVGPETGVLVTPGDADELAAALGGLLGDLDRLKRFGAAAAVRAADFTIEKVVGQHEELSRRVVAR